MISFYTQANVLKKNAFYLFDSKEVFLYWIYEHLVFLPLP